MTRQLSRRNFLKRTAAGGMLVAGSGYFTSRAAADSRSPNEKLNIGTIGTANQARFSMNGVKSENLVAICDIDDHFLDKAAQDYPDAKKYNDWRKLLEQKDLDAVIVATPDHIHALATVRGPAAGQARLCEKPLTHTVAEARLVAQEAAKAKRGHANGNANPCRRQLSPRGRNPPAPARSAVWPKSTSGPAAACPVATACRAAPPVPDWMHWDLWLGPAAERPYNPDYCPFTWRRWWDFGNGAMGDMACHHMDLPFWAFDLRHPTSVAAEGPPVDPDCCPGGLVAHYEFPARGEQPPVKLTWYDGDRIPASDSRRAVRRRRQSVRGRQGDDVRRLRHLSSAARGRFRRLQAPCADDPEFDRPSCRMDRGLQDRQPDDVQFRLRRRADRSGAAGRGRLSLPARSWSGIRWP